MSDETPKLPHDGQGLPPTAQLTSYVDRRNLSLRDYLALSEDDRPDLLGYTPQSRELGPTRLEAVERDVRQALVTVRLAGGRAFTASFRTRVRTVTGVKPACDLRMNDRLLMLIGKDLVPFTVDGLVNLPAEPVRHVLPGRMRPGLLVNGVAIEPVP